MVCDTTLQQLFLLTGVNVAFRNGDGRERENAFCPTQDNGPPPAPDLTSFQIEGGQIPHRSPQK